MNNGEKSARVTVSFNGSTRQRRTHSFSVAQANAAEAKIPIPTNETLAPPLNKVSPAITATKPAVELQESARPWTAQERPNAKIGSKPDSSSAPAPAVA